MHESLIITDQTSIDRMDTNIFFHGKIYFNESIVKPEVSGTYEILVDQSSIYRRLIETKMFTPLVYFDSEKNVWVDKERNVDISKLKIIGWRIFN